MIRRATNYVVYEIVPGEDRAYLDDESYSPGWYYQLARDTRRMTWWLPVGPFDSRVVAEEAAELATDRHAVLT